MIRSDRVTRNGRRDWRGLAAFLLILLASHSAWGQDADEDWARALPEEFRQGVLSALERAGGNRDALTASFHDLEGDERHGWAFLVANMPDGDLKKIPEEILTEHVRYAYIARREMPWGKKLTNELFYHYVLPIRSAQEPLEAWRKFFYEELRPAMFKFKNMTLAQAALEVNRYCGGNVKFKRTSPDDKSPLQTHKRGYGRCEEEMIYFNAVARSIGIPTRSVSTPYWPFQDNNHAWCEVYTGEDTRKGAKGWHFLGACEPADRLDKAWFTRVVGRAALVTSYVMGVPKGENILRVRNRFAVVNTTPVYAKTCDLAIRVLRPDGKPASGAAFYISVFNFGTLRPILGVKTNEGGEFRLDIGVGDYLLSAKFGNDWGWAIGRSVPGKSVHCDIRLGSPPPSGYYWLRYPKPGTKYPKEEGHSPSRPEVSETAGSEEKSLLRIKVTNPGSGKIVPFHLSLASSNRVPWRAGRGSVFRIRGNATLRIKPGDYIVQSGRRNPNGDVHLYLNRIVLEKGKTVTITIEGDLPIEEGGALPVLRQVADFPKSALKDPSGQARKFENVVGESGTVLVFFSLDSEPCQRMLPVIRDFAPKAKSAGLNVVGIHVAPGKVFDLGKETAAGSMDLPLLLQDEEERSWAKRFGLPFDEEGKTFTDLPAVIVLDAKKKVILWQEGYDLNIRVKIEAALRIIGKSKK